MLTLSVLIAICLVLLACCARGRPSTVEVCAAIAGFACSALIMCMPIHVTAKQSMHNPNMVNLSLSDPVELLLPVIALVITTCSTVIVSRRLK